MLVDNNYYVAIITSMYQENSMIKTITFAILHFSVAFSVAYILTGSIGVSSAVALVEPIVNTVVFYFHEKAWNRYEKNKSDKQKLWMPLHQCG